jgi:hypothetical protein
VRVLLDEGVSVSVKTPSSLRLPLHEFLSKDGIQSRLGILRRLLQSKQKNEQIPPDMESPQGTEDCLINAVTREEVSPLMIAAGNAHLGDVREVSSSFEFETETLDDLLESSTGLMLSSEPTRKKNVKKVDVKAGVIVCKEADSSAGGQNVINLQEGRSRERSGEFVLEYLVGCGADATMKDMYGNTALDYAARRGVLSHVEYLCSLPTTTRAHKEHALFSAVTATGSGSANVNVVKYLMVYAGARGMGDDFSGHKHFISTLPLPGETIMHVAARFGSPRCLERFLSWMPEEAIYIEDSHGLTALHRALNDVHASPPRAVVNRCAQILVRRLVGLSGLKYAPAAPVTVADITRMLRAQDEIPSYEDAMMTSSLTPSTEKTPKNDPNKPNIREKQLPSTRYMNAIFVSERAN